MSRSPNSTPGCAVPPTDAAFAAGPRPPAGLPTELPSTPSTNGNRSPAPVIEEEYDDQPWHIVREKEHAGEPMTIDDALFQMELVGHDFYLFLDKESGRPSVVYRRKGYDYGILSLAI
jgi:hypothetical protein